MASIFLMKETLGNAAVTNSVNSACRLDQYFSQNGWVLIDR